ncbi:MAG: hypothetical protein ABW061_04990 [Polyangiaceae bacterium]
MIQACMGCGTQFESLEGKYAPDGSIVCVPCGERLATAAKAVEKKSTTSAFPGSFGALLIALLSFVLQHRLLFFLFPVLAMAAGGGTAFTALKNPSARVSLGWKRLPTIAVGSLALVLGLLSLVLSFSTLGE